MSTRSSLLILFFLLYCFPIFADTPFDDFASDLQRQQQQVLQRLNLEKQHLKILENSTEQLSKEKMNQWHLVLTRGITAQDLENSRLAVVNSQSTLKNIEIALSTIHEELFATLEIQQTFMSEHMQLNTAPKMTKIRQLWQLREELKSIISMQNDLITILTKEQGIAEKQSELFQNWYDQISQLYNYHFKPTTQLNLTLSSSKLQSQNEDLTHQLMILTQQLDAISPTDVESQQEQGSLEFKIFIIREKITVNQIALLLLRLQNYFHPNLIIDPQEITLLELQKKLVLVQKDTDQLNETITEIKGKLDFIIEQKKIFIHSPVLAKQQGQKSLTAIYQSYQAQLVVASDFQRNMNEYIAQLMQIKNNQLSMRQQLPGLSLMTWKKVMIQLLEVPVYMVHSVQDSMMELILHLQLYSRLESSSFFIVLSLLVSFWFVLRKSFLSLLKVLEDNSKQFSRRLLAIVLFLLRKNLGTLLLLSGVFSIKIGFGIELPLWTSVIAIFLVFRLMIMLAKIWLLESEDNIQGSDVRLYHGLKWIFIITGIFSVILVVTHIFPVGYEVRVLCNRILMLLLLFLSILLFRSGQALPFLIQKALSVRRAYVIRAIKLICQVVPITFLTNALIGLVGYVQLAWVIGEYQVNALLTLVLYMVVRGLMLDVFDFFYNKLISNYNSGWLWTQVFARPLEHILKIGLFIGAIVVFIFWSGLNKNSIFIHYWQVLIHVPIFDLFGNIITVPILTESVIIGVILYWFAKWSREFAFRWLYAKAKDIGIRNSLSIFTQYAVVIVGIMIALRVLGFDLTGFAVVAAAFAAGIGIGLKDVATNFISGILLLVERPFRTGDTITLGEYEGVVVSTGVRSMKIRTWDRMELIVPNAEMFSKPFINWTHQDSIVRSVVRLKIKRMDDPHRVQALILNLFKEIRSVVAEPKPEAYMKELDDSLIEFEIRYFVNLEINDSRPRVRSEVLFAIWDCFKKHGIQHPEQEYNIRVINENENAVVELVE